ncbi:MAG TPA: hypothetical protein VF281_04760 [Candidatus Saccharimonadales bacterium]
MYNTPQRRTSSVSPTFDRKYDINIPTITCERVMKLATDAQYQAAAEAVAAGQASKEQKELNKKMADHPRAGSPLVQKAQDAYKNK